VRERGGGRGRASRRWGQRVGPPPEGIDALSLAWERLGVLYAHPPTALIAKVLAHWELVGAEGVLVVPEWRSAPWWPHLTRQVSGPLVHLGNAARALERGSLFPRGADLPGGSWCAVWISPRS